MSTSRTALTGLAVGGLVLAGLSVASLTGPAAGAPPGAAPGTPYELRNGRTAPIHDYAGAIRETVWVTAPDFDDDGEPDRVAADIIRPRETAAAGVDVPVVMDASPYHLSVGRGNEGEFKTYAEDGSPEQFPLFYDNYFVPRGYAFVAVDVAGTARSTGCVDQGGVSDVGSVEAVVKWLNGNAEAVDAEGEPVTADWTNGRTGMIGKSYDGTIANGVAATGVEGLETIVPISAISSWYDYDRSQGLPFSWDYPSWLSGYVARNRTEPVDCSATLQRMAAEDGDETGAYDAFWAERDHRQGPVTNVGNVEASVFVYHGLQDTNVKTRNFSQWWTQLGREGVTRKMWLTRVGHVDPFDTDRSRWVRTLHRWFDSELMGIDNGILDEREVDVEVRPDEWVTQTRWPARGQTTFTPRADGRMLAKRATAGTASWVNDPQQSETAALTSGNGSRRLLFASGPLRKDTRMSGTATATLGVTTEVPVGQVGVMLVDYGLGERVLASGDGAVTTQQESCHGSSTSYDDACYFTMRRNVGTTPLQVLGRGWARLDGAGRHDVTVRMDPDDTVVSKGHRLGLVVVAAAPSRLRNVDTSPTSRYTLDLAATSFSVPGKVSTAAGRSARRLAWLPDELVRGTVAPPAKKFVLPR
ncbi:CocE/NonD family hydrolase [Nocardioides euryhalodurans]|uniref:CocE/NonD family hydrolase n=1 Tax=Nocardioides euryhalodurans TaxID=2518370 RepID=UPI00141F2E49|nr:CocE/NonD family hydrolase [Nocardioides euryhalodurans]